MAIKKDPQLTPYKEVAKKISLDNLTHKLAAPLKWLSNLAESWWHVVIVGLFLTIFLYYPIGGLMISHLNKDVNVELKHKEGGFSSTVDTMAYIIDSEVNTTFWTPNLPFFFPSYFLDNMPNFQLGKISALAKFSHGFDKQINKTHDNSLTKAAELLQYPGTIWMFSPDNKITPVPSAGSQYRKARKQLLKFNEHLENGSSVFMPQPDDLSYLLKITASDLTKSSTQLETQIRESASSMFDFKADDVFYYNQGKTYSYFLLLKALSFDYKDIIVSNNLYPDWIKMLKALEDASRLDPWMVRNSTLDSAFNSNHLNYLAFYNLKAANQMQIIRSSLEKTK